jgi:hypothetical protein
MLTNGHYRRAAMGDGKPVAAHLGARRWMSGPGMRAAITGRSAAEAAHQRATDTRRDPGSSVCPSR